MSSHVAIALLYQVPALHSHLKDALTELGARVVYDSTAEAFDRGALSKSGAEVVVVNLDPEVSDEFEHLDELLSDDHLKVIFNDAEVSSRLEGWEQARWARHLAAKILGVDDTNPPRPVGAEAIPVRVKSQPQYVGAPESPDKFQLGGHELATALAADTGESLRRTRAALQTSDEPVAAELVPPESMLSPVPSDQAREGPTLELARDEAAPPARAPSSREAPTLELSVDELALGAEAAATPVLKPFQSPADLAFELDHFDADAGAEPAPPARSSATSPLDDFGDFADLALDAGTPATSVAAPEPEPEREPTLKPPTTPTPIAAAPADVVVESVEDFAAELREFGFLSGESAAPEAAAVTSAESAAAPGVEDEFDFGALQFEPVDGEADDAAAPAKRPPAEPLGGLDDFLLSLGPDDSREAPPPAKPAAAKPAATPPKPVTPAVAAPKAPAAPAAAAAAATTPAAAAASTPVPRSEAAASKGPARELSSFSLSHLSLEPIEGEGPLEPAPTGRATYRIDDPMVAKAKAEAEAAAKAAAAPASTLAAGEDDLGLPIDFDFDSNIEIEAAPLERGDEPVADQDLDLIAELQSVIGEPTPAAAPAGDGPVRRVWVLGASIGGPEAVREFLGALPKDVPALFLLAQHMGADFLDLMTQQLARATPLAVRTVASGDRLSHGQVVIVPLAERLLVDASGEAKLTGLDEMSPYSPSIDQVMRDVADRFGARAGAIIFSGMAHDAIDGAVYMAERGGTIWAQDPATCVISSMVDGARDAGVVGFVAAPTELARRFMSDVSKAG